MIFLSYALMQGASHSGSRKPGIIMGPSPVRSADPDSGANLFRFKRDLFEGLLLVVGSRVL
jgi:hypothetical protein